MLRNHITFQPKNKASDTSRIDRTARRYWLGLGTAALLGAFGTAQAAQETTSDVADNIVLSPHAGLGLKTGNDRFAIALHGLLQTDGAVYDDSTTPLGNGTRITNAKLIVAGHALTDWAYRFQVNFAKSGKKQLENMFVQYNGFTPVAIRVGNFKEPFSLEFLNGNKNATFMFFAPIHEALVPKYRLGGQISSHGRFYTAQAGVFANRVQNTGGAANSGLGGVARGVITPIHGRRRLLLFGLAGRYRPIGKQEPIAINSRPDSVVTRTRLVGFGPGTVGGLGPIRNAQRLASGDAQIAAVDGPFAAQAEWVDTHIDRRGPSFNAHGGYVQTSYFLTGESRAATYRPAKGAFSAIEPNHAHGAWQLAVRYDTINLNSGPIHGGHEHDYTAAINDYVNRFLRFDFNYVHTIARYPDGPNNDANIYQARAQLAF